MAIWPLVVNCNQLLKWLDCAGSA